jgi:hypothetical protein
MKTLTIIMATLLGGVFQVSAAQNAPKPVSAKSSLVSATTLRSDMRKLWSDHVFWTRDFIIAAVGKQPDETAATTRLLKNQEDIGNAVGAYYGKAAGEKLTGLLKEHIVAAAELTKAAAAHDQAKFQQADQKAAQNAEAIAEFLSKANPNWSQGALSDMMRMHLITTKNEVAARVDKNWEADVKAFDEVYDHIVMMSDALTDGIVKQFPEKFTINAD